MDTSARAPHLLSAFPSHFRQHLHASLAAHAALQKLFVLSPTKFEARAHFPLPFKSPLVTAKTDNDRTAALGASNRFNILTAGTYIDVHAQYENQYVKSSKSLLAINNHSMIPALCAKSGLSLGKAELDLQYLSTSSRHVSSIQHKLSDIVALRAASTSACGPDAQLSGIFKESPAYATRHLLVTSHQEASLKCEKLRQHAQQTRGHERMTAFCFCTELQLDAARLQH